MPVKNRIELKNSREAEKTQGQPPTYETPRCCLYYSCYTLGAKENPELQLRFICRTKRVLKQDCTYDADVSEANLYSMQNKINRGDRSFNVKV